MVTKMENQSNLTTKIVSVPNENLPWSTEGTNEEALHGEHGGAQGRARKLIFSLLGGPTIQIYIKI